MNFKSLLTCIAFSAVLLGCKSGCEGGANLTLIPPGIVTDKIELDIRGGIVNNEKCAKTYSYSILCDGVLLQDGQMQLAPGESCVVKCAMPTIGLSGEKTITLSVNGAKTEKSVTVVPSDIRSNRLITGAWAGICHWSETEGKHWNPAIKSLNDGQWREMVRSMHKIGMDIIVIQEVFRNEEYVNRHNMTVETYEGKAYYPSKLYPGRMEITAENPVEAILCEADELGMQVMMGVGMFAWFDFTEQSLQWHKNVARELWDMYGHHDSFYGFYISEEQAGCLYMDETDEQRINMRKQEMIDFFKGFREFTHGFAPGKPVMLATNTIQIPLGLDAYPELLENLDILCPFCFARMPEGDLSGKDAADLLQSLCDAAGCHLWFDLEAFLFNEDGSLYPRPSEEIISDLNMFENFEKILCYQYPGVFSDPEMSVRVGEDRCEILFEEYSEYRDRVIGTRP